MLTNMQRLFLPRLNKRQADTDKLDYPHTTTFPLSNLVSIGPVH